MFGSKLSKALASAGVAAALGINSSASADTEPTGLAASYLSAIHAQSINDPEAASHFLGEALKLDPDNGRMILRAYFQKAQTGDIEGALPYAEAAYKASPNLSLAPLLIASAHFKAGQYDKTLSIVEQIETSSTIGASLPLIRAWARAPLMDHSQTLASLAPYEGRSEWRVVYAIMAAMLNEYYGRKAAALVYYRALANNLDRQPLSVLRVVAEGFHRLGRKEEATTAIERYRSRRGSVMWEGFLSRYEDPEQAPSEVTVQMGMAEALYAITRVRMRTARRSFGLQISLVYAHLALYLNPDLEQLYQEVADAVAAQGQYEAANEMLNKLGPSDAGYLVSRLRMAENYERDGKTDEAIELLKELARLRPNLPEPLVSVGDILRANQRFGEAVDAYDQAFARYPDGKPESWALYYTRGIALERTQKWGRAEKDFKQALELNPEEADVLNYLGYSWLDRGENVSEARRLIELAVSKKPESGFIVDSLGWAMFLMGEYEDAVVQLERAVSLEPSDATINEHLGDAYWKVGRENEAQFQWRRALTMEPEDEQANGIRRKMELGLAQN